MSAQDSTSPDRSSKLINFFEKLHPKVSQILSTYSTLLVLQCHYGYFVIIIAGSFQFWTAAGSSYGIGFFTEYFIEDLGMTRTSVSAAWSCAMIGTAITIPFVGRFVDRLGPRVVMFCVAVTYALSLFLISFCTSPILIGFLFLTVRISMASLQLLAQNVINQWWIRRKGFAMSFANSIGSLSLVYPSFLSVLVKSYGWRGAFLNESIIVLCISLLLAALTLDRPEKYAYFPDARRLVVHGHQRLSTDEQEQDLSQHEHVNGHADGHVAAQNGNGFAKLSSTDADTGADTPAHADSDVASLEAELEMAAAISPSSGVGTDSGKASKAGGVRRRLSIGSGAASSEETAALTATPTTATDAETPSTPTPTSAANDDVDSKGDRATERVIESKALLVHVQPSDQGPTAAQAAAPAVPGSPRNEVHWYWQDALRTRMFWTVTLSNMTTSLLWAGFNFHFVSIFLDHGMPASTGDFIFLPVGVGSFVCMFVGGAVFDRITHKSRGMCLGTLFCTIALVCLISMQSVPVALVFGFFFGMMDGIISIGYATVFAFAFGRVHLATIDAIAGACGTLSIGLGALIFGAVREHTGSYTPLLIGLMALSSLMTLLLAFSKTPPPPSRSLTLSATGEIGTAAH